jgi:hypothetical protein
LNELIKEKKSPAEYSAGLFLLLKSQEFRRGTRDFMEKELKMRTAGQKFRFDSNYL